MGYQLKQIAEKLGVNGSFDPVEAMEELNGLFKEVVAGKDLAMLIEEGCVFKMNGEQIGTPGEIAAAKPQPAPCMLDAVEEMRGSGIMVLDETAECRPCHVFLEETLEEGSDNGLTLYATTPLQEKDLGSYMKLLGGLMAQAAVDEVGMPGFFNRLWDTISSKAGGAGTEEMNQYRAYQKQMADELVKSKRFSAGAEKLEKVIADAENARS